MEQYKIIEVKESVFADNDREAARLREDLKRDRTFLLNLMSSPGSGKTTTLLRTIEALKDELRMGVMEADIDSDVDAAAIAGAGVRSIQLHTGGMCHLDAGMTEQGLREIGTDDLDQDFRYAIKQHGAMLAKGRLLGLQFLALLNGEDGTGSSPYYTMAAKADRQAMRIRAAFEAKGCAMLFDSPTNQQFPILPNSWYNALSEKYAMTLTAKPDAEHTAVRFCTSWATRDEDVDALLADIASL